MAFIIPRINKHCKCQRYNLKLTTPIVDNRGKQWIFNIVNNNKLIIESNGSWCHSRAQTLKDLKPQIIYLHRLWMVR